jgi:hypothetical protein
MKKICIGTWIALASLFPQSSVFASIATCGYQIRSTRNSANDEVLAKKIAMVLEKHGYVSIQNEQQPEYIVNVHFQGDEISASGKNIGFNNSVMMEYQGLDYGIGQQVNFQEKGETHWPLLGMNAILRHWALARIQKNLIPCPTSNAYASPRRTAIYIAPNAVTTAYAVPGLKSDSASASKTSSRRLINAVEQDARYQVVNTKEDAQYVLRGAYTCSYTRFGDVTSCSNTLLLCPVRSSSRVQIGQTGKTVLYRNFRKTPSQTKLFKKALSQVHPLSKIEADYGDYCDDLDQALPIWIYGGARK